MSNHLELGNAEISAILSALPLILSYDAETETEANRRYVLCNIIARKITSGSAGLTKEELGILSAAIEAARNLLCGKIDPIDLDVSKAEMDELRRSFFIYNKLGPLLDRALLNS